MRRKACIFLFCFLGSVQLLAQYSYGTTGLLNMPTADMQEDKTVLIGGSYLEKHTSPGRWFYDTFNYYVNITIFPWLEVAYDLTLHKAFPVDPAYGRDFWVPRTYGKFVNQDRNFAARIRIWKEGWWRDWTPQIVIGSNDVVHNSWENGSKFKPISQRSNGFKNRYYLAITKHIDLEGVGQIGAHFSYVYNNRPDYRTNAPAVGADLIFDVPITDEGATWQRALNGLNLMLEFYPVNNRGIFYYKQVNGEESGRGLHLGIWDVNMGGSYSFLGDLINLYGEFYGCRYFSGGVQFRLHLK